MDLSSFVFTVRPLQQASPERPLPRWWGSATHNLALKVLQLNDEGLSAEAHDGSRLRPFTVTTLHGNFPGYQFDLQEKYLVRFTGLNAEVSKAFLDAQQEGGPLAPGALVELDFMNFEVQSVSSAKGSHPLVDGATYPELATASLLDPEPATRRVTFYFASATAFHRQKKPVPFPVPELVIGSLLERWNQFAPVALPEEARRYAAECLIPSRFEIKSRTVSVAGGVQNGFVGRVSFKSLNYDRYWMSLMHTLARFSFYSGVGVKTAMGMGQCRRVVDLPKKVEPAPAR